MLTRIWAVLRTIYVAVVTAAAAWAIPWAMMFTPPVTEIERNARLAAAYKSLVVPAWLAIGWLILEAAIGWVAVWRLNHAAHSQLKRELRDAKQEAKGTLPPPEKPTTGA